MTAREVTPIRCERCRAVFALESTQPSPPVVQCARCQFVFEAAPAAQLGSGGTLGGAASFPSPNALLSPPEPTANRRTGLLVVLTIVCLVLAVALSIHLFRSQQSANELSSLAPVRLAAGEALLWRDDTASLESAVAAFSEAEVLDPQRDVAQSERATATMLLGLSLRSEAELMRLEGTPTAAKHAEERTTRAEKLMHEGAELADEVFAREKTHDSWAVLRAHLLAQALSGTAADAPADSKSAASPTEPSEAAWRAFCRAVATRVRLDGGGGGIIRDDLEQAHRLSPGFRRATWMLAAQLLVSTPRDSARAEQLVNEIIRTNADHDLALKLRSVLKSAASP